MGRVYGWRIVRAPIHIDGAPMSRLKPLSYIYNLFLLIDVAVNVIIIGCIRVFIRMPDEAGSHKATCSMVFGVMRNQGSKIGCYLCQFLTWWQNKVFKIKGDHCDDALGGD